MMGKEGKKGNFGSDILPIPFQLFYVAKSSHHHLVMALGYDKLGGSLSKHSPFRPFQPRKIMGNYFVFSG